jgi:Uma2 family endonuclease
MNLYAKHGVKEYWVVSITDRSIKIYVQNEGRFELAEIYRIYPSYELDEMTEEEKAEIAAEFSPFLFPDMKILLEDVFGGMLEF